MKTFARIFRWIAAFFVLCLVSVFVVEYYRMSEAKLNMAMYTNVAGNYAITAAQDVNSLTDSQGHLSSCMYDKNEYGEYLKCLEMYTFSGVQVGDTNRYIAAVYEVLHDDYIRACNETYSNNLDGYLKYTPLSFNMPYVSDNILEEEYENAIKVMIENDNILGSSAIYIKGKGHVDYVSTSMNPANIIYDDNSSFEYGDAGDKVTFDIINYNTRLLKSVYGNEEYYVNTVMKVLEEADGNKYTNLKDYVTQYVGGGGDYKQNATPIYTITFNTDWAYITSTIPLNFGSTDAFWNNGTIERAINRTDGAGCWDPNRSGLLDPNKMMVRDGQLIFHSGGMTSNSVLTYTLLG